MWCSSALGRVCWTTPSWATTPASLHMDRQVRLQACKHKNLCQLGNIDRGIILEGAVCCVIDFNAVCSEVYEGCQINEQLSVLHHFVTSPHLPLWLLPNV